MPCFLSTHEKLVDASEFVCDLVLTDKITQGFFKLAHFVGESALQAGNAMQNMLPPELMDSSLKLSTNAGEVIAVFAGTGETVDCVMASKASMDRFAKNTGKGAGAKRALDGFDNALNSEQKKGTPEWDEKYPNWKYEGVDYHREEAKMKSDTKVKSKKSPAPQDGQAALDRSLEIPDSPHRVAIEDDKYVIFYETSDGIYHGFTCDQWKDVPDKAQSVFKKNKLVHPKSGDIKK